MSNPRVLLSHYDLHPKKSLGQNFLHDPNTLQKIVSVADVTSDDTVLEIGTGTGSLTVLLGQIAKRVITLEVDERLVPILREELAPYPQIELYWMDALEADIPDLVDDEPYKVVANLPYYITSALLRKILESNHKPQSATLTVQKEVAERMVAQPKNMSLLSVSVQFYGQPKIATKLKPSVFWPRPDVDSAVVHIDVSPQPTVEVPDEKRFFEVVRAGFSQKRKQLKNSLASGLGISAEQVDDMLHMAHVDGRRRAETLELEEWAALARAFMAAA